MPWNVPCDEEENEHEAVDVPPEERLTLDGQVIASPEGVEVLRLIVPASPERLVILTVPLVEDPDENVMEGGDNVIPKSITVTGRITQFTKVPLVPCMYTMCDPVGPPDVQVGYSFAEPPAGTYTVAVLVRLVNQHATPGEDGIVRVTVPENPPTLVTVTTVCFSEPTGMAWDVGLTESVKVGGVGELKLTVVCALGQFPIEHVVAVIVAVPTVDDLIVT